MSTIARGLVAVMAVAIAGWLGLQAHGARADEDASAILLAERTPTAQQLARAENLIGRMERLNPDTRSRQLRGLVAYRRDDMRRATATFRALARDEPENLQAWALLARAAERYDPPLAATARSRIRELAPPVRR